MLENNIVVMSRIEDPSGEELVRTSRKWPFVGRTLSNNLADSWFEEYTAKSVRESLLATETAYDEIAESVLDASLIVKSEFNLIPQFSIDLENLGYKLVPILQSSLGVKLMEVLKVNGLTFQLETKLMLNDFEYVDIAEESAFRINLGWDTDLGTRFNQMFQIYAKDDGQEYCYWHSAVLYASRPLLPRRTCEVRSGLEASDVTKEITLTDEEIERGAITFEQWSKKIHLPWLAKTLFYLAENPLRGSFFSLPRSTAFPDLEQVLWPIPHIQFEKKVQLVTIGTQSDGLKTKHVAEPVLAPEQFQMGWLFGDSEPDVLWKTIKPITEGLIRISSYLQDGFLNHNDFEADLNFDAVVLSGNQFESRFAESASQGAYYRWIPTTEVFSLLEDTKQAWESSSDPGKSPSQRGSIYAWIADEGIGNVEVASSINEAIFQSLIPEKNWGAIEFYAPIALQMSVKDQSTKAMSNWGIAFYLQGKIELAITAFEIVLEREDKFAENEACFYLSKIYEKQGDLVKSEEYRKRCEAAGGYEPTFL